MTYSVLSTIAEGKAKAGANADTTILADTTTLDAWSLQVDGRIELATKRTWTTDISSLGTEVKKALSSVHSSMMGILIIAYNPNNFFGSSALTLMNVNDDIVKDGLRDLENFNPTLLGPAI